MHLTIACKHKLPANNIFNVPVGFLNIKSVSVVKDLGIHRMCQIISNGHVMSVTFTMLLQ